MESIRGFLHGLPLFSRFALAMALLLVMPRLAERARLPAIVGFIAAGFVLGPHGFRVARPDGPIMVLFSDMGKLLLMFFAGFEVDLVQFARNRRRSLLFGLATFGIPLTTGAAVAAVSGYSPVSSVLVGSLLASHTLVALPIILRLGLIGRDAVLVTVGATVFTDIAAMLVLAICIPVHLSGFSPLTLLVDIAALAIFVPSVLYGLGWIARFLIARYGQTREGRVMILLPLIALTALGAELIRLEGIVGAFLAGLALRRGLRETRLDDTLEVVAHSLFIPAFFVATGLLIDVGVFAATVASHPVLAVGIVGGLFAAKYLAAFITNRSMGFSRADGLLMWSLSVPQVAATLAAALVAYRAVNAAGIGLIDATMLNTILVMVIMTSLVGPILTERFARPLAEGPPKPAAIPGR